MTAWLRALVAALPLPHVTVVLGDYVAGDVVYSAQDDEDCDCDDHADTGTGVGLVGYRLPASELRELFEEVAHFRSNGATDDQAADHGMATLMLRSVETGGNA